jgi:hypothetical protein
MRICENPIELNSFTGSTTELAFPLVVLTSNRSSFFSFSYHYPTKWGQYNMFSIML